MKVIINKTISLQGSDISYADLMKEQLKVAPKEGFSYELMSKIGRVLPKLEANGKKIELEDADFEFLKEKIVTATWGMYSPEFVKMIDYIKSL